MSESNSADYDEHVGANSLHAGGDVLHAGGNQPHVNQANRQLDDDDGDAGNEAGGYGAKQLDGILVAK